MKPLAAATPAAPADADGNQLLAHDEDSGQKHWSIRILSCGTPCQLSPKPGNSLWIAALDGPLQLSRASEADRILARLQTASIGAQGVLATPTEGTTRVFCLNLHASQAGQLLLRPLVDHMMLPTSAALWFAHVLAGRMNLSNGDERMSLEMNQSAWLRTAPGRRVLIEGAGELALVQLPE